MTNKVKYQIVLGSDEQDLGDKVNALILEGYQPIGNLSVSRDTLGITLAQALYLDDFLAACSPTRFENTKT